MASLKVTLEQLSFEIVRAGSEGVYADRIPVQLLRDAIDLLKKQNEKIIDLKKERKDYQTALAMTEQELDELKFERRALFSRR